jgi:hypothetical protein
MGNFKTFCQLCVSCGSVTSKSFARAHAGLCKACDNAAKGVTTEPPDISNHPLLCPNCHEHLRTRYQQQHGYKCDSCVREYDRETNYAENPEYRFGYQGD